MKAVGSPPKEEPPKEDPPKEDPRKASTGIAGFDEITGGGLPRGRTTLLMGGPGSGKTIFTLQFLTHGARYCEEPGIFVAFEETRERILMNSKGFGWKLAELQGKQLFFLDGQPDCELIQAGNFDLSGLLAALACKAKEIGARRVVLDALDVLLALLPDPAAKRRELHRIHAWLLEHQLTGLITAKGDGGEVVFDQDHLRAFMQFMVDCTVVLNHRVVLGVSQRNLRVQKYRGSGFDENEAPFVIDRNGLDVALSRSAFRPGAAVSAERVSSGVARLDTMLGGGYYRGASILITGLAGTAKTTLCGAFAEAAARRGERTMFVSYDSDGAEVIRNLCSVGIDLKPHVESGLLSIVSARTVTGSAESLMVRIKRLAMEHEARCVVIDPVSTLFKAGNERTSHGVAERLVDWTKSRGITLACTSLLVEVTDQTGRTGTVTPLHISTMADTWIHLDYLVQAGERNRGISIIKSRGMAHSSQVRELILSHEGVTLADTYTAGGEVLMGTMRREKENAERVADEIAQLTGELKRVRLDAEEAVLELGARSLQTELVAKRTEKSLLERTEKSREKTQSEDRSELLELRGADHKTVKAV